MRRHLVTKNSFYERRAADRGESGRVINADPVGSLSSIGLHVIAEADLTGAPRSYVLYVPMRPLGLAAAPSGNDGWERSPSAGVSGSDDAVPACCAGRRPAV